MTKRLSRIVVWFLTVVIILGMAELGFGKQVVVKRKDGRTIRGELVAETDTQVTLNVDGIPTTIKRRDIESLEDVESIEDLYHQRRARIADDDLNGRYELAKWLHDQKAYVLALKELDDLHKRFPDDRRVSTLQRLVANRLKLKSGDQKTPATSKPTPPPEAPVKASPVKRTEPLTEIPTQLLSDQQINLIKLYEVDLDEQPAVRIPRDVIEKLFQNYSANDLIPHDRRERLEFRRLPPWRQLDIIFRVHARELYPLIDIRTMPRAIRTFKTTVQKQYLLSYCASAGCHGGKKAGDFFLFTRRSNDDRTLFTNFYILSTYENEDGLMIDRSHPDQSLLLQYGLSRDAASKPHPPVKRWRPRFPNERARQYQAIRDWINQQLFVPKPDYGVDYAIPRMAKPATPKDAEGKTPASPNAPAANPPKP